MLPRVCHEVYGLLIPSVLRRIVESLLDLISYTFAQSSIPAKNDNNIFPVKAASTPDSASTLIGIFYTWSEEV